MSRPTLVCRVSGNSWTPGGRAIRASYRRVRTGWLGAPRAYEPPNLVFCWTRADGSSRSAYTFRSAIVRRSQSGRTGIPHLERSLSAGPFDLAYVPSRVLFENSILAVRPVRAGRKLRVNRPLQIWAGVAPATSVLREPNGASTTACLFRKGVSGGPCRQHLECQTAPAQKSNLRTLHGRRKCGIYQRLPRVLLSN